MNHYNREQFDTLAAFFLEDGISSSLMYLHNSPGMRMLKRRWQDREKT